MLMFLRDEQTNKQKTKIILKVFVQLNIDRRNTHTHTKYAITSLNSYLRN